MKPIQAAEQGPGIEAMADVEGGWFVGAVGGNVTAATVLVVRAASLSVEAVLSGKQSLDDFLIPDPEKPEILTIAHGTVAAFKNPFDAGSRIVTTPNITELWPRTIDSNLAEATSGPQATDVFDELTPEKQQRVCDVIEALGDTFNRDYRDFSVVKLANEVGDTVYAVALTSTARLDLGDQDKTYDSKRNWNDGIAEDDDPRFTIEVNGERIDTRSAITIESSKVVAATNREIDEWIWLFGQKAEADTIGAPMARIQGGQAFLCTGKRMAGSWGIGFRPIVVI